jgi:hypothetical protein
MDDSLRVNTETLRAFAPKYKASADVFGRDGPAILDYIISLLAAMPDYDGRLQQQARADAEEINAWCKDYSNRLSKNADSLLKTAQAFEDVDNQTVIAFAQNQVPLRYQNVDNGDYGLEGIDVGTSYLGYRDDGISDTVILCMYGVCKKIVRKGNEKAIEEFEKNADAYVAAQEKRDDIHDDMILSYGAAVVAALATGVETVGIGAVIVLGLALYKYYVDYKNLMEEEKKMVDASYGAAYYWDMLTGDNLTGDDLQDVGSHNGEYGDIY